MRRLPVAIALQHLVLAGVVALLASCGGAGTGSGAGSSESSPFEATDYEFLESWGATDGSGNPISGTGSDAFAGPSGMIFRPDGDIYVTDRNNSTVKVYSATGTHQVTWDFPDAAPNLIFPSDIAYDPLKKQFAVIGNVASELYFFNADGTFPNPVSIYFPDGTGTTEAKDPQAIAVDDAGYLYLLERDNNRIQVLETDGSFVEEFSDPGTGSGQFTSPREIFVDPLGNRYVTGSNNRVLKYDDQWNFITEWGSAGTGPGEFDDPAGLTVDSDGYVYVADQNNHRVQVFLPVD